MPEDANQKAIAEGMKAAVKGLFRVMVNEVVFEEVADEGPAIVDQRIWG